MTKTVNKEAFRMLAVEIGLNEACRKLGVPIPTGNPGLDVAAGRSLNAREADHAAP
jgi:phosphoribosylformylglycinamidine (FGAM) synthase-like enzyme